MRKAEFFSVLNNNNTQCNLCFHKCILSCGQISMCFGKKNIDGILYAENYGKIITINDDPIEKKPLFHYYPGEYILSVAQSGCNLRCPFCQNYEISNNKVNYSYLSPDDLYNLILNKEKKMIAFTYTEPLMWYEYIYDFSKKHRNIKTVIVSNGCINKDPMRKLSKYIDAANIDLKSFNEDFYKKELNGDLNSVKESIIILYENNVHIEITNLLINNKNDNLEEFINMIDFITSISPDIPFHISRYFPSYKYSYPPTPPDELIQFYNIAKEKLKYVYIGNFGDTKYSSTFCPKCNNLLIKRNFYSTEIIGIKNSKCSQCGELINIIY